MRIKTLENKAFSPNIQAFTNFENDCMRNRIWYRGDPSEIEQYFKQANFDNVSKARFWAAVPSEGFIRKFHSGIYAVIIDALTDLVLSDYQGLDEEDGKAEIINRWAEIAADNKWDEELLRDAITETLTVGDGVFKVSMDPEVSEFPIIEFVSGENVEIKERRGRPYEYLFKTEYTKDKEHYILEESYKKNSIEYKLKRDKSETEIPLDTLEETAGYKPVTWQGDFFLCVPMSFYKNPKYKERGMPILDRKSDNIDALDEVCSQWIDAIRAGRVKNYIPEDLLPKNPETGETMRPNSFDNQFIRTQTSMKENAQDTIDQKQAVIDYSAFSGSYASMLDLVLQGVVSPSSLGIDLKPTDNAEAQREKEKTTVKTRQKIVDTLTEVIPELIQLVLRCQDNVAASGRGVADYEITASFGEYASPAFEQRIMIVNTASVGGIMSIETQMDELWGDSKSEEWKQEEVERIKQLRGIVTADEMGAEIDGLDPEAVEDEEAEDEQKPEAEADTLAGAGRDLPKDGNGSYSEHEQKPPKAPQRRG